MRAGTKRRRAERRARASAPPVKREPLVPRRHHRREDGTIVAQVLEDGHWRDDRVLWPDPGNEAA